MAEEKVNLEAGVNDVIISLSPAGDDSFGVSINIPTHIEKQLETDDETVPPYVLVAFQICQYINDPDNMARVSKYFEEQMDESLSDMTEEEAKNGISD